VCQNKRITFISNRIKGISNTLRVGWPSPHYHHCCLKHIKANFQKYFKDKDLYILLWQTSCASDPEAYKAKRAELKATCEDVDTWIKTSLTDQEHQWALLRDEWYRLCVMITNASESFNDVLKGDQALSIQALIVRILFYLVKFFQTRWENAERWYKSLIMNNKNLFWDITTRWRVFIQYKDSVERSGRCQTGKDILALWTLQKTTLLVLAIYLSSKNCPVHCYCSMY